MAEEQAVASSSSLPQEQLDLNLALLRACDGFHSPPSSSAAGADRLAHIKQLLEQGAHAWYEDARQAGWSSLHFAAEQGDAELCRLLLREGGAIWNAVDQLGFTAAEVAASYNHLACYRVIFEEGVRQTVLLNLLGRMSGDDDEEEEEEDDEKAEPATAADTEMDASDKAEGTVQHISTGSSDGAAIHLRAESNELTNDNDAFLRSKLRFLPSKTDPSIMERCLDQDGNMVMAAWETDIMQRSAAALCAGQPEGFAIVNIGFGLGIVDRLIQTYKPARHVIVEAHPDALQLMRDQGWHKIPGVEIVGAKWEDAINDPHSPLAAGGFDAVYFDTYSQDYADLRAFFEELPNIMAGPEARFSFCE